MKITITTSAKNIEMANFLLSKAFENAKDNKSFQEHFDVTDKDIQCAETFRKSLLKAFLK